MPKIGFVRGLLLLPWACKWNGWVREATAWVENKGLLSR
jgi:hypothetical protein